MEIIRLIIIIMKIIKLDYIIFKKYLNKIYIKLYQIFIKNELIYILI
jgi:hypothetical protein